MQESNDQLCLALRVTYKTNISDFVQLCTQICWLTPPKPWHLNIKLDMALIYTDRMYKAKICTY